jgi:hypothetical protein
MVSNWLTYTTPERRTAWGIPQERYDELEALRDAAAAILLKARDDTQRTPVVTVQCQGAFDAQEAKARFFKSHYFLEPPLEAADLAAMGLKPPGGSHADIPAPAAEGEADLAFPDYHLIDVLNIRRRGPPGDLRSYHGAHIHVGVVDGTGPWRIAAPPATAAGLPWSLFTRRRRERFDFLGNSGKAVYICIVWANEKGWLGPPGPIISGIIP